MSELTRINVLELPVRGPWSNGVRVGDLVFTSGQVPVDPTTGLVPSAGMQDQVHQSMRNIEAILAAAGTDTGSIVKVVAYLRDYSRFRRPFDSVRRALPRSGVPRSHDHHGRLTADHRWRPLPGDPRRHRRRVATIEPGVRCRRPTSCEGRQEHLDELRCIGVEGHEGVGWAPLRAGVHDRSADGQLAVRFDVDVGWLSRHHSGIDQIRDAELVVTAPRPGSPSAGTGRSPRSAARRTTPRPPRLASPGLAAWRSHPSTQGPCAWHRGASRRHCEAPR